MEKHIMNRKNVLAAAIAVAIAGSSSSFAQSTQNNSAEDPEVIVVTGIRDALASALNEKRNASSLVEVIKAEDIGKLPDQNLAEVLENITGVQIDRTNGVGTGVQIRGASENRVEINGISTVTSGSGRTGISFEDLPAALIESLEVIKTPTAKTIEGSVGGTINLRTLRGTSLKEPLAQFRVQAERSDLADATTPRISGTLGNNWDTDIGKVGVVVTGSYAELNVASANPRFDRDRVNFPGSSNSSEAFPFLRTQFLDQPLNAEDYETKNFTASFELVTNNDVKVYFDATVNDQVRARTNSRVFFSGVGGNPVINNTNNTGFTTIDLGSVDGRFGTLDLGEVQAVTSGVLGVGSEVVGGRDRVDPNLRTGNNNGSRITKSNVFALGSEWYTDKLKFRAEISHSDSDTNNPSLNSSLDFINPNSSQPSADTFEDNGTPAIFNISGETFEFGIAPGLPETPTTQQLLDPANYAIRSIGQSLTEREASETAARFDVDYDISERSSFFTNIGAGIRWSKITNSQNDQFVNTPFGNFNRPRANLFTDIVRPGANNFNVVDSRSLFIEDYLIIDNDISLNNPQLVIDSINQAIAQNNANLGETVNEALGSPVVQTSAFFDIDEETLAIYIQGDFEKELGEVFITGNIGGRYITTEQSATGTQDVDGQVALNEQSTDYNFFLPRFNISAEVTEDFIVRAGIGQDIRRPDFDDLSPSANFRDSATAPVFIGNPELVPEEIWSYDLSFEYYFSPSSILSIGFFHKDRENLLTPVADEPAEPIGATGQVERDVTPPCEGGGIFNPIVQPENFNVFSTSTVPGICVARNTTINAQGSETQTGVELAAQYDLSAFEDQLGWASGFGVIANYTYQRFGASLDEFRTASFISDLLGRTDSDNSTPTLDDDVVTARVNLDNLSENSFNFTLFYDKHNLNARVRYTWRDSFTQNRGRTRFNIPPVIGARGQLNMSINYDINEHWTVGVEGVNLTREDRIEWCFNEGALLCEQSLADRRVTFGVTARL